MEVNNITNGEVNKTYLIVSNDKSNYSVKTVTCTDAEIKNGYLQDEFGINGEDEFSLMTASCYVGEREIIDIEIGEVVEIDYDMILIRVA